MACILCEKTPGWHSFQKLGVNETGASIFYCQPSWNPNAVQTMEDMNEFVKHFPTQDPWIVLMNCNGYTLRHMIPVSIAIRLGQELQAKASKNLQAIYIVQGSWLIRVLTFCVFPFLSKDLQNKFFPIQEDSFLQLSATLERGGVPSSLLLPYRRALTAS